MVDHNDETSKHFRHGANTLYDIHRDRSPHRIIRSPTRTIYLLSPTPLLPEPRKQPQRIPPIHPHPLPLIHLIPIPHPRQRPNRLPRRIREIRPEQNPPRRRKLQQQIQRVLVRGQCQIIVKAPRVLQELLRWLGAEPVVRQHVCRARGEIRQRAAGVGEDDSTPGVLAQPVAHDEVHGRAGRFVRVVDHGLREGGIDEIGVGEVGGVDEDDGGAGGEGGPDGDEVGVAEVAVSGAVAGVEGYAIRVEDVEGVGDFGEGGVEGVEEGGEGGEEAEGGGGGVPDRGRVFVDGAGELGRCGALEDGAAGGCEGEDAG